MYRHSPVFCSATRHNSMIGRVKMYCEIVFWRQSIYSPISSIPTIDSAAPMDLYTHVPSRLHLGPRPAIRRTTRCWKPSRVSPTRGSVPTSQTQIEAPLAPLPHKTSPPFFYLIPPFQKSSTVVHKFSVPSVGSVPPPSSCRWRENISPQVLERSNHHQKCPILREDPLHLFLCLLSNQPPSLPFLLMP